MTSKEQIKTTALHKLHTEWGGRLVPFAGWELPIHYEGVVAEHRWCRKSAALFDVSHMATIDIAITDATAEALETTTPANISSLKIGRSRYGVFTNNVGGVIDDFIVTRFDSTYRIVSNASRRSTVQQLLTEAFTTADGATHTVEERNDVSLLAVQGPLAVEVLSRLDPTIAKLRFMQSGQFELNGIETVVGRSGYTGEDGFELTLHNDNAEKLARWLVEQPGVKPAGLGARDSLRLEAGLCLYGNDLNEAVTPIEADLAWTIGKSRRAQPTFPGAKIILDQLEEGPSRIRVGVRAEGRRPIRDNNQLATESGEIVGEVTSGGFGPTLDAPVAMAYVASRYAEPNTKLVADVRGSSVNCVVTELPFTPHNYFKG